MKKINVIVNDDLYSRILTFKSKLQKNKSSENIDVSYAVRYLLSSGLKS